MSKASSATGQEEKPENKIQAVVDCPRKTLNV